jgi:putative molybdenum carrier protein
MKLTIVSGGQTGADRGAFDAAIALGLDFGGWAPAGFAAEDGRIPEIYASHMREAADTGERGRNVALRTRLNVQDSDATLIVSFAEHLTGGSKFTASTAKQQRKNCQHLVLPARGQTRIPDAVRSALLAWLRTHHVEHLNVAGPRESKEPGLQEAVRDALVWIFEDEVAEDLRAGADVLNALAVTVEAFGGKPETMYIPPDRVETALEAGLDVVIEPVDSDAPAEVFWPRAPHQAMLDVWNREVASAEAKLAADDALMASAAASGPFWGVGKTAPDPQNLVGLSLAPADGTIEPGDLAVLETSIRQAKAEILGGCATCCASPGEKHRGSYFNTLHGRCPDCGAWPATTTEGDQAP